MVYPTPINAKALEIHKFSKPKKNMNITKDVYYITKHTISHIVYAVSPSFINPIAMKKAGATIWIEDYAFVHKCEM